MRERIAEAVSLASSLEEVENAFLAFIEKVKIETGSDRIGYVAGTIYSDGEEHIARNIARLAGYTEQLSNRHNFPIFCAGDIFGFGLFERLAEMKLAVQEREAKFISFWRNVIGSGHISDLFMAPGWEKSVGATDEHCTALEAGIALHYVK